MQGERYQVRDKWVPDVRPHTGVLEGMPVCPTNKSVQAYNAA
jgi:hypothetical protein